MLDADLLAKGQVAACRDDVGSDGLWWYEQGTDALRIHALDRRQRRSERSLQAGRFTDEIATGLPVPRRASDGRIEHFVPTMAGVVVFGTDALRKGLYLPAFPDLPRGATPSVLHVESGGRVTYLGGSGLVGLEDETSLPLPVRRLLPDGAKPLAVESGPGGALRLGWQRTSVAGWTLFDARAPNGALQSTEPVNTATWRVSNDIRNRPPGDMRKGPPVQPSVTAACKPW